MTTIEQFLTTMRALRDPDSGCSWIRAQTMASILPFTLEETYELMAAVEQEDADGIRDELADLLYHIVYYAEMAAEQGLFDFPAIVEHAREKLIRRHPHVFDEDRVASGEPQAGAWESRKREERRHRQAGVLDGVSPSQPALIAAAKLQKRAGAVGFDWHGLAPVLDKLEEEISEIRQVLNGGADADRLEDEIGDLLFACVNAARHAGCEPESALRGANRKFIRRFEFIERELSERGQSPEEATMEEMEALWQAAKKNE